MTLEEEAGRVRRLWQAGSPVDAIARTLRMRHGMVAMHLESLGEEKLLEGLRAHLEAVRESDHLTRKSQ